jgi:hypothetical protein
MPYDCIGVKKAHLEGEDKFILVEMDSKLGKPFMQTSNALSKDEAADALRKRNVPEEEIARLLALAERE